MFVVPAKSVPQRVRTKQLNLKAAPLAPSYIPRYIIWYYTEGFALDVTPVADPGGGW